MSRLDTDSLQELLQSRFSVRAYTEQPVPLELMREILTQAGAAPSGSNLQPVNVHALAGEDLAGLIRAVSAKIDQGMTRDGDEVGIYPEPLISPYRDRRFECGMALYAALDIKKEDKERRQQQWRANYEFFGAPVGLIFTMDASMLPAQFIDLGLYMQSVMLLARDNGLDTCAQLSWAVWPNTVREYLGLEGQGDAAPPLVIAGMALGYGDRSAPVNQYRTSRIELSEYASLRGFQD